MLYEARIEFQTLEQRRSRTAQSITIHFKAEDDAEAVAAVLRWWANRHRNLEPHFNVSHAVQIFVGDPREISEDGGYDYPWALLIFEWKSATGFGPGVTKGAQLVKDPRMSI